MADSGDKTLHDVEMEVEADSITSSGMGSRKRRLSQDEIAGPSKRTATSTEIAAQGGEQFNLLDFSDEVLLEILLHCNSITLQVLTKTCRRFESVVGDRRLWNTFDFSKKKMTGKEIRHLLKYATKETKVFKVRGLVSKHPADKHKNKTLTSAILSELRTRCHDLETFEVHEGFLNFEQIQISQFPEMLKRLVFNGCLIKQPRSPRLFNKIDQHLHFLEELSLEKCDWFETHDLVVLSKLMHLKRLNLRGCPSLKEFVPYGSIAARFGFKNLEWLDIRDTQVCDSDIQCFNITTSLREILMECPAHLRRKKTDPNSSEATVEADAAGPSKDTVENSHAGASTSANDSGESDVETGSEIDGEDSEEDEDAVDDKNGLNEETASENGSGAPPNQNHYIQVIIHDGHLVNVNNGHMPSPAEALQRFSVLRRADQRLRQSMPPARERRETREIETQTDRAETTVSTRPNETQTDPCTSGEAEPVKASDEPSKPSTSECVADTIGIAGPSNIQSKKPVEKVAEEGEQNAASPSSPTQSDGHRDEVAEEHPAQPNAAVDAGPVQAAPVQPNPVGGEQRPRLIIIHQGRRDEFENAAERHRRISWEINNRPQVPSFMRQLPSFLRHTSEGAATQLLLISDRGMCSFGMPRNNVQEGIVWIRAELRPADTPLERITVRNYRAITDVTLRHLASCAPNLQYLDVTGTSVTAAGIGQFIAAKPQCQVIWSED